MMSEHYNEPDKFPHIEPYYSMLINAVNKMNAGDAGSNPPVEIVYGYYSTLAVAGRLHKQAWEVNKYKNTVIALHKEFLDIQDDFYKFEPTVPKGVVWNSKKASEALRKYVDIKTLYRNKHIRLFQKALERLTTNEVSEINKMIKDKKVNRLSNTVPALIGVPWYSDYPNVWLDTGLSKGAIEKIASYAKINECGIVYASRIHRHDMPEGHDYFSYALRLVNNGIANTVQKALFLTAQHEGAHGPTDEIVQILLNTTDGACIYEGLAGSLGEDGKDRIKTKTDFSELVANPMVFNNPQSKQERIYHFGAKYYSSLTLCLCKQKNITREGAWIEIMRALISLALRLSKDKHYKKLVENDKVSKVLTQLPNMLGIPFESLEKAYFALNA